VYEASNQSVQFLQSLEIFNGVLYIITAGIIAAKWKPPILPEVIADVDVIVIDEFKLT